jgi:hypothetical protein
MSEEDDEVGFNMDRLRRRLDALEHAPVVLMPRREIPVFSGERGQAVGEFVEQVEEAWASQGLARSRDRMRFLWSHLSTRVRDEILCYPEDVRDSGRKVLGILKEVYGDKRSVCQLLTSFNGMYQRAGEDVREFGTRLNRAFRALVESQRQEGQEVLSETLLRDHFIGQLSDVLLSRQLKEKVFDNAQLSFFEIREAAIRWDSGAHPSALAAPAQASGAARSYSDMPPPSAGSTAPSTQLLEDLVKQLGSLQAELAQVKQELRERPRQGLRRPGPEFFAADGRPICLRCKQPGHIKKDCRQQGNGQSL